MQEDAYPVPFTLRREPPWFRLLNASDETVHGVALSLHGPGRLAANAPATLHAGEALEVVVYGEQLERGTILVVRWFRPDRTEYLWRVSF